VYSEDLEASGSGIIVADSDEELLIVTNNHVVEDANSLEVTFIDGTSAEAKIKGTDSDMDLAVIAVDRNDLSSDTKAAITVANLGDSDDLKLGEPVIAIGNALGYGQSVTNGIVSALDREIEMEDGTKGVFIQTNAAINPGNSGGALLNIKGEVIGINSNKIGGTAIEGMGYAIPITSASPIIAELMERRTRSDKVDDSEMGYIGIELQEVTSQISSTFNMPEGIYVVSTVEGGGAANAGIMTGDIITKFDGQKISSYSDLQNVLQYYAAGETVTVTVMRPENGEYVAHEFELTLGSRPQN
jgi:serine protease Do